MNTKLLLRGLFFSPPNSSQGEIICLNTEFYFYILLWQEMCPAELFSQQQQQQKKKKGLRGRRPACVVYLPLPLLLDISLRFWSSLLQLNVMLSSSTLSRLKCFYPPSCLVWHECAHPERTADHTLQENSGLWNWVFLSSYRTNTLMVFTVSPQLRHWMLSPVHVCLSVWLRTAEEII